MSKTDESQSTPAAGAADAARLARLSLTHSQCRRQQADQRPGAGGEADVQVLPPTRSSPAPPSNS